MDLWFARLVLTQHHRHRLHFLPSATSPRVRVSSSFFLSVVLFIWQAAFALFQSNIELFSSSYFLSKEYPLFIQPTGTPSCYLDLRILASAELQLCQTCLPGLIPSITIWSEWTRPRRSPLAWCRMSLECIVGTHNFLATLVTLSLQLWNLTSTALEVRHEAT
jgi:hypothetical protein